ncbi:hypothetical protein SAMN05444128_3966 [Pontibacter indicus]|uniref:Uncharacterized protein n=1 Tax=Pontibacter indicus TaxID=1317125 RepID=A0A1R3XUA5_9BACT|nr:hypothetical protein SAMN05444128_3966 [Pontibacter indicus]
MRLLPHKTFSHDRQASAVARAIAGRQERLARRLNRRFAQLALHARKTCLLCFCLLMGGASSYLLLAALLPTAMPPASHTRPPASCETPLTQYPDPVLSHPSTLP